ncbi:MAG: DUF3413 domain-containing protein [Planctomycetota bacterium]|nr:MAG: DUF3413 domain-containing protein [Planctomycetota bacterium]
MPPQENRWILPFAAASYGVSLANTAPLLRFADWSGISSACFNLAVLFTYALIYLLPAIALTGLAWLTARLFVPRVGPRAVRWAGWAVMATAAGSAALVQTILFADRQVFSIFGVHFNGFVWNLITTPGGIASMGASEGTEAVYGLVVAGFFALHAGLLLASVRWERGRALLWGLLGRKRRALAVAALFLVLGLGERIAYGVCRLRGVRSLALSAQAFPLYQPLTFRKLGRRLGLEVREDRAPRLRVGEGRLHYPQSALEEEPSPPCPNIVWLVSESLRADALDPEIMPAAWAFAQKARRFLRHYSGGNGTRMGMFSQFYGLYGAYWFPFLEERRPPVLMDLLRRRGYQFSVRTSMNFTYPEFDKTIFAGIPRAELHEAVPGLAKWECDRFHVGEHIEFLRHRDRSRPFFLFQFFESPHARYWFPPESVVREPYLEEFNYATADLERDIELIRNRYLNSCHHLDSQLGRLFAALEEEHLLDSTIVILTGDHGEEFMEKGRWGHNSEFHEEQIRVPFVLWVPGLSPGVTKRMTSHLDVPATILPLLGVTNDPADYSQGTSLLADRGRDHTVVCDWRRVGYVDDAYKAALPLQTRGLFQQRVTDANDRPLPDPSVFYRERKEALGRLLRELGRFRRPRSKAGDE